MKNFVNKILAIRHLQSQTDFNDLGLVDFNDKQIEELYKIEKEKDRMNNMDLLEKVTDAATFLYTKNLGDSIAPNILISKLPNKQYYVSVNRYMTPSDRYTKTIVFKSTKSDLFEALMDIAKFLSTQKVTKTNPIEELEKLFKNEEPVNVSSHTINNVSPYGFGMVNKLSF